MAQDALNVLVNQRQHHSDECRSHGEMRVSRTMRHRCAMSRRDTLSRSSETSIAGALFLLTGASSRAILLQYCSRSRRVFGGRFFREVGIVREGFGTSDAFAVHVLTETQDPIGHMLEHLALLNCGRRVSPSLGSRIANIVDSKCRIVRDYGVNQQTHNPLVLGSNASGPTNCLLRIAFPPQFPSPTSLIQIVELTRSCE